MFNSRNGEHPETAVEPPVRYDLTPFTMFYLPPRKDDVDAGFIFSEARVGAWTTSPNSIAVGAKANDSTPLPQKPGILLEKSLRAITKAAGIDPTYSDAGDTATFHIFITNTGNTRLSKVVLTDVMFGENITCDHDFSGARSDFLPLRPDGHPIVCEAVAYLTSVDVNTGYITSTAEVSGSTIDTSQCVYVRVVSSVGVRKGCHCFFQSHRCCSAFASSSVVVLLQYYDRVHEGQNTWRPSVNIKVVASLERKVNGTASP